MIAGRGFDLHPLAAQDITDIWTSLAEHQSAGSPSGS